MAGVWYLRKAFDADLYAGLIPSASKQDRIFMSESNVYQQLFNQFVDKARKDKDVEKAVSDFFIDIFKLLNSDPGPCGIAKFRGVTFNTSKDSAADAENRILAVFRGNLLDGSPVVSFANGPSVGFAAFSWLQSVAEGSLNWKADEPKSGGSAKRSLADVIASS